MLKAFAVLVAVAVIIAIVLYALMILACRAWDYARQRYFNNSDRDRRRREDDERV